MHSVPLWAKLDVADTGQKISVFLRAQGTSHADDGFPQFVLPCELVSGRVVPFRDLMLSNLILKPHNYRGVRVHTRVLVVSVLFVLTSLFLFSGN